MSGRTVTVDALRRQFEADTFAARGDRSDSAGARLARALRAIGWGGVDLMDADELASELIPRVDACVTGYRDLSVLYADIAELLRHAGPLLDGSLPPAEAYLPAAEDIIRRYVADAE